MPEIEVVIQMSKLCPFNGRECNHGGCRLWSEQFDACGAAVNHLALAQVAEALQNVAAFISIINQELSHVRQSDAEGVGDGTDGSEAAGTGVVPLHD